MEPRSTAENGSREPEDAQQRNFEATRRRVETADGDAEAPVHRRGQAIEVRTQLPCDCRFCFLFISGLTSNNEDKKCAHRKFPKPDQSNFVINLFHCCIKIASIVHREKSQTMTDNNAARKSEFSHTCDGSKSCVDDEQ